LRPSSPAGRGLLAQISSVRLGWATTPLTGLLPDTGDKVSSEHVAAGFMPAGYVPSLLQKGPEIGKGQGISEKLLADNFEPKEMNDGPAED
jgi:hypothetical protein